MIETESVLDTTKMAYPFGRCAGCGKSLTPICETSTKLLVARGADS